MGGDQQRGVYSSNGTGTGTGTGTVCVVPPEWLASA